MDQKGISCESSVDFGENVHSMMELWPRTGESLDVVARYESDDRSKTDGSPWLVLSMISSLDGAAATEGVSGGLGAPADRAVFKALRGLADAIVVAAGTVRTEDYGPPRPDEETRARRVARGQTPAPRIAVVSGSLSLDPHSRLFSEGADGPDDVPLVFTAETADGRRRTALAEVAEIRSGGPDRVGIANVVESLAGDGHRVILAEGGPTLNGQLLTDDLVDELCLSLSPTFVGGQGSRIVQSTEEHPHTLTLDRVGMGDGLLLLRYLRR